MTKKLIVPQVGRYIYLMNDTLLDIEKIFKEMFREGALKLRNYDEMLAFDDLNIPETLSLQELINLSHKLGRFSSFPDIHSQAKTAFWVYYQVFSAYLVCLKEGFGPFLTHVRELENSVKNDPSQFSKKKTIESENFQKIVKLVAENIDQHPKFINLKDEIFSPKYAGYQKIIFAKKSSAFELREMLLKHGIATELILNDRKKDSPRNNELVEKLKNNEIKALILTFVPKKPLGLNYPMIVHYQIPERKGSRIKKNISPGSLPAFIFYLFLDHGLERRFYFLTSDLPRKKDRRGEIPFDDFKAS